jgi:hypothetical protein
MSEEPRPDPLGPTNPLMHHQAGVISAMLDAMCKEDKDMVLSYLGLMEIEDAPPPEARKMGEQPRKKQ